MRKSVLLLVGLTLIRPPLSAAGVQPANARHGAITFSFLENSGQFSPNVRFRAQSGRRILWFTNQGVTFDMLDSPDPHPSSGKRRLDRNAGDNGATVFAEKFANGRATPRIEASASQSGITNYFIGNNPTKWRTGLTNYSQITYEDVWPGIDVRFIARGSDIEQEFVVKPGSNPDAVRIDYSGITAIEVSADGSLIIKTIRGELRESSPRIYQPLAGRQAPVSGRFVKSATASYTFKLGPFDKHNTLVIDPTLLFSTYIGGNGIDTAEGIAVDAGGNTYIAGSSARAGTPYPTTPGAFQTSGCPNSSCSAATVTKFDLAGNLVYSTFLGGDPTAADTARGIAVDSSGNAYVVGLAYRNFPTTANGLQANCDGSSFLTKLNAAGSALLYSTCLGADGSAASGSASGFGANAVALDTEGRAYLTGSTLNYEQPFPTTANAFQPNLAGIESAFLSVIDPNLSGAASLVYSTYLGGEVEDFGMAIAVDSFGSAYVTGYTRSSQFPTTANAFQTATKQRKCPQNPGTCATGFVAKLNPRVSGTAGLIYSTYLGGQASTNDDISDPDGSGDYPSAIGLDSNGSAYVAGRTDSPNFPATAGAFQTSTGCGINGGNGPPAGFVTKISPSGSTLAYSTFLRGTGYCAGASPVTGLSISPTGNAFVTGSTNGASFPVTPDAFQNAYNIGGAYGNDAFLTEFSGDGSSLVYSSYLGGSCDDVGVGITLDSVGDAYLVGYTCSPNFPVTPFAFQPALATDPSCQRPGNSCYDEFVTKFPLGAPGALAVTGIDPNFGGNAGAVTPAIIGAGFHAGAKITLKCGSQAILATNTSVTVMGRILNGTFNLTGVSPGVCDVVASNVDGTSATLPNAFTVTTGGAANVQVYLSGVVRVPPSETSAADSTVGYFLTATNTGALDAPNPLIASTLSPSLTLTAVEPAALQDIPSIQNQGSATWSVANLAPGQSARFAYGGHIPASATMGPASALIGSAFPLLDVSPPLELPLPLPPPPPPALTPPISARQFLGCTEEEWGECVEAQLSCAKAIATCTSPNDDDKDRLDCEVEVGICLADALKCPALTPCVPPLPIASVIEIFSIDPNGIVGPPGAGSGGWIDGSQEATYAVSFSNETAATAPAQRVIVSVPLNPGLQAQTLALGDISIPNGDSDVHVLPNSFKPLAGINEFVTTVDLRPNKPLLVAVDAKLDPGTQTLTWTFNSVNPATGAPPIDPSIGFLPPGIGASVSFSARPNIGLSTGDTITEQASIVFDANSPLNTTIWSNGIDKTAPVSKVSPLTEAESGTGFAVAWTGIDAGSGIQSYNIFVSDNGAPFTAWLTNTALTQSTYGGVLGHTYGFYSIATDFVGNQESAKTKAEAKTAVIGSLPCASDVSSQVTITRSGFRYNHATKSFVQTVTLINTGASLSDIALVLDGLSSSTTLSNSGGATKCTSPSGSPWIAVSGTLRNGQSVMLPLTFTDSTMTGIQYSTRVLAGGGQQ